MEDKVVKDKAVKNNTMKNNTMKKYAFVLLFCFIGCDATITVPIGEWGGEHISLVVIGKGGIVEYDCAEGTIDEKIVPDAKGNFSVKGTHTPSYGVIKEGQVLITYPARFEGNTDGRNMTFTVTRTDIGQAIGTFSLSLGTQGRLFKCLESLN